MECMSETYADFELQRILNEAKEFINDHGENASAWPHHAYTLIGMLLDEREDHAVLRTQVKAAAEYFSDADTALVDTGYAKGLNAAGEWLNDILGGNK
jgi:hypothetical protein